MNISKTNESNLPTEEQSFGLGMFKRKIAMSSQSPYGLTKRTDYHYGVKTWGWTAYHL